MNRNLLGMATAGIVIGYGASHEFGVAWGVVVGVGAVMVVLAVAVLGDQLGRRRAGGH